MRKLRADKAMPLRAGFALGAAMLLMGYMSCCVSAEAYQDARIAWLWDGASVPTWSNPQVAILVRHILLRDEAILQRPRTSSPTLRADTLVTPVVHVEISMRHAPAHIEKSRDFIVAAVLQAANLSTSGWVQLDMEARPSHREFYLALVRDIRQSLPSNVKLSVTALAWWCRSPQWMDAIAADEVVPMFFRMGPESQRIRQIVEVTPEKLNARCTRDVAGFSAQEPFPEAVRNRYIKTYWFDDRRWHQPYNQP